MIYILSTCFAVCIFSFIYSEKIIHRILAAKITLDTMLVLILTTGNPTDGASMKFFGFCFLVLTTGVLMIYIVALSTKTIGNNK